MDRQRSVIWDIFTKVANDRVKCSLCSNTLSYKGCSTTNLFRHMRNKHPHVNLNICQQRSLIEEEVDNPPVIKKRHIDVDIPINDVETAVCNTSTLKQVPLKKYLTKPVSANRRKDIDEQVCRLIVKSYNPFRLVEDEEFKRFVRMLNPAYELPSRKHVSDVILPSLYEKTVEKMKILLKNIDYVCLTTDGWTSIKNEYYLGITIHFIDNDCKLCTYCLSSETLQDDCTSQNIANRLKDVVEKWGLCNKVAACVTDNAPNMIAAIKLLKWWHIPCYAHTLNLIVQDSLKTIKQTREKVKEIVEHFRRSHSANEKLQSIQKQMGFPILKLKQDIVTRWNSTYEMFERFLMLKEPVLSTLAILNLQKLQITDYDWTVIEMTCTILSVFKDVTTEMSAEKNISLSKIGILSNALINHCDEMEKKQCKNVDVQLLIKKLKDECTTRLQKYKKLDIVWEATFLDPRFKRYGFEIDEQFKATKERIINKAKLVIRSEVVPQEDTHPEACSSIWGNFDKTVAGVVRSENPTSASIIEVEKYTQECLLQRTKDPLVWWQENKSVYPRLFELMKRRLCLLSTSVPSERLFSKQGQIITEKRNRISSLKTNQIVFLNMNL